MHLIAPRVRLPDRHGRRALSRHRTDPRRGSVRPRTARPRDPVPASSPTTASARAATWSRKLCDGLDVEDEHVFTCAMATARFLAQQKPGGTAFVIGEGGLLTALHQNGYAVVDHDPDYVVVGEGRTFNLEMVEAAVRMILGGAKLIATNLDPNCPTQNGLRPGCGAMVAMLETATGVKAFSVGKPSPVMMRAARKELGLATDETTMIGDTMETDILGGVQLGFHTVLVLSGGTKPDDLPRYAYRPEMVVDVAGANSPTCWTATTGARRGPLLPAANQAATSWRQLQANERSNFDRITG